MRTFLILTVSLLAPYALYTAGCNQNRQAAFPNTPEMQALARAPERDAPTRPPVIPAAIDREVLAANHDAAAQARLQAVTDRSNHYAMAPARPGLFVLPAENQTRNAAPMPSAREFWSRPVAPVAQQNPQAAPADVFAMAPGHGFEPLPEPITTGPAVPIGAPFVTQSFMTPLPPSQPQPQAIQPMMPPAPRPAAVQPAPAPRAGPPRAAYSPDLFAPPPEKPYNLRPGEKLLPPEPVPGIFMGTDAGDDPLSDAPKLAANTTAGIGLNAVPPLLFPAARDTAAVRDPAPLPAPAAASFAPPPSGRLEALLKNDDLGQALAPLSALPAADKELSQGLFMPPPPVPAANPVLPPAGSRDFYRMDVPEAKRALAPLPEVKPEAPPALPALPPLAPPPMFDAAEAAPAAPIDDLKPPEEFAREWEPIFPEAKPAAALVPPEAPKRVSLKPIRAKQELQGIDSSVDAPPLKF